MKPKTIVSKAKSTVISAMTVSLNP
jgi:hypothetical protein